MMDSTTIDINGQAIEALNKTDAARELNVTHAGLTGILKRTGIKTYKRPIGRDVYVRMEDVRKLKTAKECS